MDCPRKAAVPPNKKAALLRKAYNKILPSKGALATVAA